MPAASLVLLTLPPQPLVLLMTYLRKSLGKLTGDGGGGGLLINPSHRAKHTLGIAEHLLSVWDLPFV